MNIQVLFSDLDGTLVSHGGEITIANIEAARCLQRNGIQLVLVSGRHTDMMKRIHADLGLTTPVIGCNGAFIKNLQTQETLYIRSLSQDRVLRTIQIAQELNVDWVVYEQNKIFYHNVPQASYPLPFNNHLYPKHLRAPFTQTNDLDFLWQPNHVFVKVLLITDRQKDGMQKCKDALSSMTGVDMVSSAPTFLDIMTSGSNKALGIEHYCSHYRIDPSQIAAIGDAANDLSMIQFAKLGIAMGNANDSVQKAANYITSEFPTGFKDAVTYLTANNHSS